MCRVPRVILVAPSGQHAELRRALASLEYEIVAAVASVAEADGITADVAVLWDPDADAVSAQAEGLGCLMVKDRSRGDVHCREQ